MKTRRRVRAAVVAVGLLLVAPPLLRTLFQRQLLVDQLQRTKGECRRADQNLLLAMATFGDRIEQLGIESRLLPKEELAFYKAVYDQSASEPAERFAIATARRRAGVLHLKLHEPEDAHLCFTLAIHMLEALADENSDPQRTDAYLESLTEAHADHAGYQAAIGDIAAAEAQYTAALAAIGKVIEKRPDSDDALAVEARVWHSRGAMRARVHRYGDAEADLRRAADAQLTRVYVQNEWRVWLGSPVCELIATRLELSDIARATHRGAEAIAALDEALAAFAQFGQYQSDVHYREAHADALEKLAGAFADAGKRAQAAKTYREALAAFDALAREYPEISDLRQKHAQLESRLGSLANAGSRRE